jgi:hypothetical protein
MRRPTKLGGLSHIKNDQVTPSEDLVVRSAGGDVGVRGKRAGMEHRDEQEQETSTAQFAQQLEVAQAFSWYAVVRSLGTVAGVVRTQLPAGSGGVLGRCLVLAHSQALTPVRSVLTAQCIAGEAKARLWIME